jgi:hypothetical protein
MPQQIDINVLFADELNNGIPIFAGGKDSVQYQALGPAEEKAVETCFQKGLKVITEVSPKLGPFIGRQLPAFKKWAGVAKASFPTIKTVAFPSQPGMLGVNFLIPQSIKYNATPSATYPCYSDYPADSWDLSLTASSITYLLGSASQYYKASPTDQKHSLLVLAAGGIVEIGTTPGYDQVQITTEILSKYGVINESPLGDQSIETDKTIYRHEDLGMLPMYYDLGVRLSVMPRFTKTSTVKMIGMVFYEHDLYSSLTTV